MGKFLTTSAVIKQSPKKGLYTVCENELYQDDDASIYLVWRGFWTDNFTWINSSDWDIRCSHGHDVGCKYGEIVRVNLSEKELRARRLLYIEGSKVLCKDIPLVHLEKVKVTGHQINNLFYRMLRDADNPKTPKLVQFFYRAGVCFNIGWFGKKDKLVLEDIYKESE